MAFGSQYKNKGNTYNNAYWDGLKDTVNGVKVSGGVTVTGKTDPNKGVKIGNTLVSGGADIDFTTPAPTTSKSGTTQNTTTANSNGSLSSIGNNNTNSNKGLVSTRPYLYSRGEKYGYSQSDMDKYIGWDDSMKSATVGGQVLGTPSQIINGVSYYDKNTLDNAFDNFVQSTGATNINEYQQGSLADAESARKALNKLLASPDMGLSEFKQSDIAKNIYEQYNLSGSEAASRALTANYGGNIGGMDSFSAAQAARVKYAHKNEAEKAVLDAYNAYIQNLVNAANTVSGYSKQNAELYENAANGRTDRGIKQQQADDTTKLNDSNIKAQDTQTRIAANELYANLTGKISDEIMNMNNPYLNSDGTLKSPDIDYQARINANNERLKDPNISTEDKNAIEQDNEYLGYARIVKTGMDKWKQYANTGYFGQPTPYSKQPDSSTVIEADKDRKSAYDLAKLSAESQENIANTEAQTQRQANQLNYDLGVKTLEEEARQYNTLSADKRAELDYNIMSLQASGNEADKERAAELITAAIQGGGQLKINSDGTYGVSYDAYNKALNSTISTSDQSSSDATEQNSSSSISNSVQQFINDHINNTNDDISQSDLIEMMKQYGGGYGLGMEDYKNILRTNGIAPDLLDNYQINSNGYLEEK